MKNCTDCSCVFCLLLHPNSHPLMPLCTSFSILRRHKSQSIERLQGAPGELGQKGWGLLTDLASTLGGVIKMLARRGAGRGGGCSARVQTSPLLSPPPMSASHQRVPGLPHRDDAPKWLAACLLCVREATWGGPRACQSQLYWSEQMVCPLSPISCVVPGPLPAPQGPAWDAS